MINFNQVYKSYHAPEGRLDVLKGVSFTVNRGDMTVIQGPSGSGKSTLLFIAGGMLSPCSGSITFDGGSIYDWPCAKRNRFRGNEVGFVFQKFHLVPYLTVEENLLYALRWNTTQGCSRTGLSDVAERLGIKNRLSYRACRLSAGEQQRVAVARAILGNKSLICADEPTGNLDNENAAVVLDVLAREAQRGSAVILVTHQSMLPVHGNIRLHLSGGSIEPVNPGQRERVE